jgi:cyanophycinase-like exopeptidase
VKRKVGGMGIIVLAGGNEFRENCRTMDSRILKLIPNRLPRVAILPTAAIRGSPRLAAENGVRHFTALGAEATAVMVVSRADADDPVQAAALKETNLVYLAGGDPWYLLDTLRGSAVLAAMLDVAARGGVIAGSSAGAMVLAAQMRTGDFDGWIDALDVVKRVAVLPHHGQVAPAAIRSLVSKRDPRVSVLGIDEATACFSRDDDGRSWEVAGVSGVTVYAGGDAAYYRLGQRFILP